MSGKRVAKLRLSKIMDQMEHKIDYKAELLRKSADDVVITLATRTAVTKARKGGLKDTTLDELLIAILTAVRENIGFDAGLVEDVSVGNVLASDQAYIARAAVLASGFPETTAASVCNRFCSSGLLSIQNIANQIITGSIKIGIAVGAESMSTNPDNGAPKMSQKITDHPLAGQMQQPMGQTSENVAGDFDISREDMDQYAAESFNRAETSQKSGWSADEITPVTVQVKNATNGTTAAKTISEDDGIRYGTTVTSLSKVKSAFPQWKPNRTTGGNASQISDGAAAVVLMRRSQAQSLGLRILGKYVGSTVVGLEPRIMGIGPALAIPKVLDQFNLKIGDIDLFEINEAFGSMAVYCVRKLGLDRTKVNARGGAIALGHPLGCTGVRQVVTVLSELRRQGKQFISADIPYTPIAVLPTGVHTMANAFRTSIRRFSTAAARAASAATEAPTPNAYGIRVSKTRGVVDQLTGAIGNTPLIRLRHLSEQTGCNVLGKAEFQNPGGSVKDRAALYVVKDAEERGLLKAGGTVVEGTAGNTGIGLAHVCRARGYRLVIYMPNTQSQGKVDLLRLLGAEVYPVPAVAWENSENYNWQAKRHAERLLKEDPEHGAVWTNQFDNIANRRAHIETTGPEIWAQTDGKVDAFTCATGTGGTLAGTTRYLKDVSDGRVKSFLADPPGSVLFSYVSSGGQLNERKGSSITEGIGQGRVTDNLKNEVNELDGALNISDEKTIAMVYRCLDEEGLYLGASSALNVVAAKEVAEKLGPNHTVVTMLCDGAYRYADRLFSDKWLRSKGLRDAVPEHLQKYIVLP
ncbi:hypothetical protein LTR47_005181 [Exophiala xenobiotica]|nr:hypothetical protein LTR47_005181 [Exophiala xenobiotica]KAK5249690.1 hypothetical protein LTS06_005472 [Exophiala xenobiotica]KAK5356862.1 hypothetical protein LTR61_000598 [Exophiala xenobiotica]KAK5377016.1 hypothetical protein LTR11_004681 [Exophiala xenobiotica]KAK5379548.1 hypothetical protein LTS03_004427 [Exophiala xenobiotica]